MPPARNNSQKAHSEDSKVHEVQLAFQDISRLR